MDVKISVNDPEQDRKEEIKAEVAQLNAQAVVGKLQDFEARLCAQDRLIADLQGKLVTLEKRLNVQLSLEAMASKMGSGPTSEG